MSYVLGPWSGELNLVDAFFYLAVVAWGVVVLATGRQLIAKAHRRAARADVLWPRYRHQDPAKVKQRLIVDIGEAYVHNRKVIEAKSKTSNCATIAAAVEGLFIVLALALSR